MRRLRSDVRLMACPRSGGVMSAARIFAITGTSAWWSGKRMPGGGLAGEWERKVKIRTPEKLRVRHPAFEREENGQERQPQDPGSKTEPGAPGWGTRRVGLLGGCFWIEKAVGFDELFGGHKTPEGLAASGSEAVTGRASTRVPRICGDVIERHTFTGFVKVPETCLSIDVALLCS
jgi:hypothetical protein